MGKTSKRKFAQLASVFSRRKGAKEMLGHAPAPSNDNLLLNADPILAEDELANRVNCNMSHSLDTYYAPSILHIARLSSPHPRHTNIFLVTDIFQALIDIYKLCFHWCSQLAFFLAIVVPLMLIRRIPSLTMLKIGICIRVPTMYNI